MGKIEDKDIDLHIDRETLLQEYIPKADYENRLKADMVAMLTDIQLEIQEYSGCSCSCSDGIVDDIDDVIQQKINSLKEDTNQ